MCTPLYVLRIDQRLQVTPETKIQWVKTGSLRQPRRSPYSSYQNATNKLFYLMFPALWDILYNYVSGAWYFEKSAVCQSTNYRFLWLLLLLLLLLLCLQKTVAGPYPGPVKSIPQLHILIVYDTI